MMTKTQRHKTNGTIQYPTAVLPAPPSTNLFIHIRAPSHETLADGFELQSSKYIPPSSKIYAPLWNSCYPAMKIPKRHQLTSTVFKEFIKRYIHKSEFWLSVGD